MREDRTKEESGEEIEGGSPVEPRAAKNSASDGAAICTEGSTREREVEGLNQPEVQVERRTGWNGNGLAHLQIVTLHLSRVLRLVLELESPVGACESRG